MAEHLTDNGTWVISSGGAWLPGSYATRKAARAAYRLSDTNLYDLWQRKAFQEHGEPDGTTKYALTEDDVREALRSKAQEAAHGFSLQHGSPSAKPV